MSVADNEKTVSTVDVEYVDYNVMSEDPYGFYSKEEMNNSDSIMKYSESAKKFILENLHIRRKSRHIQIKEILNKIKRNSAFGVITNFRIIVRDIITPVFEDVLSEKDIYDLSKAIIIYISDNHDGINWHRFEKAYKNPDIIFSEWDDILKAKYFGFFKVYPETDGFSDIYIMKRCHYDFDHNNIRVITECKINKGTNKLNLKADIDLNVSNFDSAASILKSMDDIINYPYY